MTMPTPTTYATPLPVPFDAPLSNPAPGGLYPNVVWATTGADEPSRFLHGVEIRPAGNFGGDGASGVWNANWCGDPEPGDQIKEGERPDGLDPFQPITVWSFDSCDLTEPSRAEVQARAAQVLRVRESVMVAREFAQRLKLDAADLGPTPSVDDPVAALAHIEGEFAEANMLGCVHLSPQWLPVFASAQLLTRSGLNWTTPGGHVLVFDGGYVDGLADTLVATSSPLFGWRDAPQVRASIDERQNLFVAIAERSVAVGYEAVVAAVEISP